MGHVCSALDLVPDQMAQDRLAGRPVLCAAPVPVDRSGGYREACEHPLVDTSTSLVLGECVARMIPARAMCDKWEVF